MRKEGGKKRRLWRRIGTMENIYQPKGETLQQQQQQREEHWDTLQHETKTHIATKIKHKKQRFRSW
jgi:hypothetical protein